MVRDEEAREDDQIGAACSERGGTLDAPPRFGASLR
jgi:hypothetical protein